MSTNRFTSIKLLLGAFALVMAGQSQAALITAYLTDFTNGGGFFAEVTLEDNGPDSIAVSVDIADPINVGLSQGDILGLWLDVNDETILPGLDSAFSVISNVFQNVDPTGIVNGAVASANNVNSLGPNANLNGGGGAGDDFDIGIVLGANGNAQGFVETISFDFVFTGLSTDLFLNERVGVRVQSITSPTFSGGSSKLLGSSTTTSVPSPLPVALLAIGLLPLLMRKRK